MSIKVNVGGTIFETTVDTLKKINYFKYILEDTNYDNTQILFVNRPAHIFKHVLAFAIDSSYHYPLKYKNELDFYDVHYFKNCLYSDKEDLENYVQIQIEMLEKKMNNKFDELKDQYKYYGNEIKELKGHVGVIDNRVGILLYCEKEKIDNTDDYKHYEDELNDVCRGSHCYKNGNFCYEH